ncbi:MAG: pyridoxamine 5'-phosphate oxidase family protein [Erysipelotrichales bacterium]|nr:MAG: pyridoxamine 5'-phosphate oxidase family protein [Erysipelotrichales bacterium]
MFREMRRSDRALSKEEAKDYLSNQEFGILSVIGDDGYPYGVPICFALCDDVIYLHGFLDGHKIDAIRQNPKVCFTVAGNTEVLPIEISINYTSVIAFGLATVLAPDEDEEERKVAFEAIGFKYSPKDENTKRYIQENKAATNIIKIQVEQITGKRRPGKKA